MIIVNQSLHNNVGTILVFSDNDIQLDKEFCFINDFLSACKNVEVDDYYFEEYSTIYRISIYLKFDFERNWLKLLKSLDNNLMLYCKSKIYTIT